MDSKEIKRLASDTGGLDKAIDQMKVFTSMLTKEQFNASKERAKDYQNKLHLINFNDRNTLHDLIEYTRNAALGYGITNILDNFCEEKTCKQANLLISIDLFKPILKNILRCNYNSDKGQCELVISIPSNFILDFEKILSYFEEDVIMECEVGKQFFINGTIKSKDLSKWLVENIAYA